MVQYNIKPGRGISIAGAIGMVFMAIFGVGWTVIAVWATRDAKAPPILQIIFPAFGVVFVVIALAGAWFHYHNATKPNRFTILDIEKTDGDAAVFCRHCGTGLQADAKYCSACGRPTAA